MHAADFALDIVRELARAGLGEMDAVAGAQAADLAFEVGACSVKRPPSSTKPSHTSM